MRPIRTITRTLTSAALAAALCTPAVGAGALLAGMTQPAAAADFTGKIKRIRVKKRKVGDGQYRTVVRTSTEGARPALIHVSYDALDEGAPTGAPIEISTPSKATALLSGFVALDAPAGEVPDGEATIIVTPFDASGAPLADPIEITVPLTTAQSDATSFEWAFGDGEAQLIASEEEARAELTVDLASKAWPEEPLAFVLAEFVEANGDAQVIEPDVALGLNSTLSRWVADMPFDPTGFRYTANVQAFDAAGEVGAAGSAFVADEPEVGLLNAVQLKQKANGTLKLVTTASLYGTNPNALLTARATSADGTSLGGGEMTQISSLAVFGQGEMTFADDPVSFPYNLAVQFLSAEGEPLGEEQFIEIPVVGPEALDAFHEYAGPENAEVSLHKVFLGQQADGTTAFMASVDGVDAANVGAIIVTFEEPFEGPEPDELQLTLFRRWTVVKAKRVFDDPGSTAPVQINVSVDASNGGEPGEGQVDEIDFSATAGVAGFGKGTKKATGAWRPDTRPPPGGLQ